MAQVAVIIKRRLSVEEVPLYGLSHEELLEWARQYWPERAIEEVRIKRANERNKLQNDRAVIVWLDWQYPLTGARRGGTVKA